MQVRVRMYRHGLGDCFLLTFGDGDAAKHVLIDCGTLGKSTPGGGLKEAVADIRKVTGDHLTLLIATHEHKDHLSGFLSEKTAFDKITVDHVWLAWTEDFDDDLAQQLQKYDGDLTRAVRLAADALEHSAQEPGGEKAAALGAAVRDVLEFRSDVVLGAFASTINEAMNYVLRKPQEKAEFLRPGQVVTREWLPGVRVYVLGPPRNAKALSRLEEHGEPQELYGLTAAAAAAAKGDDPFAVGAREARDFAVNAEFFLAEQPFDEYYAKLDADGREELSRVLPFDVRHRLEARHREVQARFAAYYDPENEWRRVDNDWLNGSAELALQLDNRINNTSLALAFELADGRVLLFPADAQLGNWLSWHDPDLKWTVEDEGGQTCDIVAKDLLARTILYKVGHHASHNATLSKHGLELMTHEELTALIPVDRVVAKNKKWEMPARELFRNLIRKTSGRVVRADVGWPVKEDAEFTKLFSDAEWETWKAAQKQAEEDGIVKLEPLFVDWNLT